MYVNQLQIGDLVSLFQGKKNRSSCYVRVTSIRSEYEIGIQGKDCDYDSASPALLFPIPLSIEILEKNGFSSKWYSRFPCVYGDYEAVVVFSTYADFMEMFFQHGGAKLRIQIRYVHQLQHALRLCGIDKEIEL